MYDNKIADITPTFDYIKVAFRNGKVLHEQCSAGTPSSQGEIKVGEVGFILSREVFGEETWTMAKADATANGYRLPEIFELQLVVTKIENKEWDASLLYRKSWEWASNFTLPMYDSSGYGVGAAVFGYSGCGYATWYWLGNDSGFQSSGDYRFAI